MVRHGRIRRDRTRQDETGALVVQKNMQIAIVSTNRPTVRSKIHGWTFEDSSLFEGEVWRTLSPRDIPAYESVLAMIADGWVLLGPPTDKSWTNEEIDPTARVEEYEWWLTRKL